MKKIEHFVRWLEQVDSDSAFADFFEEVTNSDGYTWAGMIVFKNLSPTSRALLSFGKIPVEIEKVIASKPEFAAWVTHNRLPRLIRMSELVAEPANNDSLLLIPFQSRGSEFGYFTLGLPSYAYEALSKGMERLGWYWSILLPYLYEAYDRTCYQPPQGITKRELECIRWASEGKTSWEISRILNISERTVNFHLANYIEKTDSVNRQQAIAKFLLQGHLACA
jgi:DNA-binding CsgD family transcriptional regulator